MGSWPSGRWQQTVNLPSESYNVSSNLSLPAIEFIYATLSPYATNHWQSAVYQEDIR